MSSAISPTTLPAADLAHDARVTPVVRSTYARNRPLSEQVHAFGAVALSHQRFAARELNALELRLQVADGLTRSARRTVRGRRLRGHLARGRRRRTMPRLRMAGGGARAPAVRPLQRRQRDLCARERFMKSVPISQTGPSTFFSSPAPDRGRPDEGVDLGFGGDERRRAVEDVGVVAGVWQMIR